jgi:hypothetical protein
VTTERRDETPYPSLILHSDHVRPGWVKLIKQDDAAPPGDFPRLRQVLGGPWPLTETEMGYNLAVTLWDEPPREYPPQHVGSVSAGQMLSRVEVEALRDALTEWLDAQ